MHRLGYNAVVLNYRRTSENLWAMVKEFVEVTHRYPSKGQELASSVEFLTHNLPDTRVLVAGESNGTVIADRVMVMLKDNPRVFSIQTGIPFWHRPQAVARTLVLNSN
ncbi:hypothetical protein ACFLW1_03655, partial [Chloroflexota bacterium]